MQHWMLLFSSALTKTTLAASCSQFVLFTVLASSLVTGVDELSLSLSTLCDSCVYGFICLAFSFGPKEVVTQK